MPATAQRRSHKVLAKATSLVRKALPDDGTLHEPLGELIACWLDEKPGRTTRDQRGHLRVTPAARDIVETACRDVQWMLDPDRHHGQQPTAFAEKTLRALRDRRIRWDTLIERCDEFRRLRQAAIRRNAARRPRTGAEKVALPGTGASATRIVTERDLVRLGREARNCLASEEHGKRYRRLLRKGEVEFWRIAGEDGGLLCVVQVAADGAELDRVKGPGGSPLGRGSAAALLEFMRARQVTVGDAAEELVLHGIYNEVIQAPGRPDRLEAVLHGERWTLEFVPGGVLARCTENDAAWVLRPGRGNGERCGLVEIASGDDDPWTEDALPYAYEASVRIGLRRACREDPALAHACAEAFRDASDVFREDWFGSGPASGALEDVA